MGEILDAVLREYRPSSRFLVSAKQNQEDTLIGTFEVPETGLALVNVGVLEISELKLCADQLLSYALRKLVELGNLADIDLINSFERKVSINVKNPIKRKKTYFGDMMSIEARDGGTIWLVHSEFSLFEEDPESEAIARVGISKAFAKIEKKSKL